jgi:sulfur transfer protein SufE
MTLKKRQDDFVDTIGQMDTWIDKFNFLIDYAALLEKECPARLLPYRIESCQSRTFFKVENDRNHIRVEGWSNSAIMGGTIIALVKIFDGISVRELKETIIDFHTRSGLADNLTLSRQSALSRMIGQILSFQKGKESL